MLLPEFPAAVSMQPQVCFSFFCGRGSFPPLSYTQSGIRLARLVAAELFVTAMGLYWTLQAKRWQGLLWWRCLSCAVGFLHICGGRHEFRLNGNCAATIISALDWVNPHRHFLRKDTSDNFPLVAQLHSLNGAPYIVYFGFVKLCYP